MMSEKGSGPKTAKPNCSFLKTTSGWVATNTHCLIWIVHVSRLVSGHCSSDRASCPVDHHQQQQHVVSSGFVANSSSSPPTV